MDLCVCIFEFHSSSSSQVVDWFYHFVLVCVSVLYAVGTLHANDSGGHTSAQIHESVSSEHTFLLQTKNLVGVFYLMVFRILSSLSNFSFSIKSLSKQYRITLITLPPPKSNRNSGLSVKPS